MNQAQFRKKPIDGELLRALTAAYDDCRRLALSGVSINEVRIKQGRVAVVCDPSPCPFEALEIEKTELDSGYRFACWSRVNLMVKVN